MLQKSKSRAAVKIGTLVPSMVQYHGGLNILKNQPNPLQTSDEVPNLVIGQRIIMAASGGNFSDMT